MHPFRQAKTLLAVALLTLAWGTTQISAQSAAANNDATRKSAFPESATLPRAEKIDSLPGRWMYTSDRIQTLPSDDRWWNALGDPMLDSLINVGVSRNYNLAAAMHRIAAARQNINQAKASYYPSIALDAGWTKSRSAGAISSPKTPSADVSYFSAGASMNWEIDVFGKITARVRQQKAAYQATRAEYTAAMVSLCGDIARYYGQLRTLQEELLVARRHILSQDSVLRIANARHEAGLASKLDVCQAGTIYYSTLATIPQLEASEEATINSIALLLGETPERIATSLRAPRKFPEYIQIVKAGLPAELLRRRPDVLEAEAALAESAAALGIAKKEFLPSLSLQGSIGTASHKLDGLFGDGSLQYSIAPTLSWTLFDGMSRRAGVIVAREQMEASIDTYNTTVLTAYQETLTAMSAYTAAVRHVQLLDEVVSQAEESLTLALDLYRGGLSSFTNVADAQISYLQYADMQVTARGEAMSALVNLYEALGGGWNVE